MASIKLVDAPSDIHLMESDINDPFVHIDLETVKRNLIRLLKNQFQKISPRYSFNLILQKKAD